MSELTGRKHLNPAYELVQVARANEGIMRIDDAAFFEEGKSAGEDFFGFYEGFSRNDFERITN